MHVVGRGGAQEHAQLGQLLRRGELQRRLLLAQQPALGLVVVDAVGAARASTCFCTSGVSTQPGQMALTVMPLVAHSSAAALVRPTMPCLAAT